MDAHDLIALLSALAVLIGALTGLLVVYYHHTDDDDDDPLT